MNTAQSVRRLGALMMVVALSACGGGGSSDDGTVTPTPPAPTPAPAQPTISTQPQSQSVLTGSSASFSVTASGDGLSYQWQKNGTPIVGATTATYTTPGAAYSDSGSQYAVVVSNAGGSVASSTVQLTLNLSADQQIFESLYVAPSTGSAAVNWNLSYSGPEASGTNYAYTVLSTVASSPLTNGTQVYAVGAPQNMTSTLAIPTPSPSRVLQGGAILLVPPNTQKYLSRVSYVGSSVQVDTLAADGNTVAFSAIRSGFAFVPLSGLLGGTPAETAHYFNSFFSNVAVLNAAAAYAPGSGYIKYNAVSKGDRYEAFDCEVATADVNISPCRTGTTLQALLTTGFGSTSDATTYHLADGVTTTVGGIPVWVATAPRPLSATLSVTPEYRIYFQINGSVYTGALIKDGATIDGSYWISTPNAATLQDRLTLLPYAIRLNQSARDSLAAAMAL